MFYGYGKGLQIQVDLAKTFCLPNINNNLMQLLYNHALDSVLFRVYIKKDGKQDERK